jgi:hypothetical protein
MGLMANPEALVCVNDLLLNKTFEDGRCVEDRRFKGKFPNLLNPGFCVGSVEASVSPAPGKGRGGDRIAIFMEREGDISFALLDGVTPASGDGSDEEVADFAMKHLPYIMDFGGNTPMVSDYTQQQFPKVLTNFEDARNSYTDYRETTNAFGILSGAEEPSNLKDRLIRNWALLNYFLQLKLRESAPADNFKDLPASRLPGVTGTMGIIQSSRSGVHVGFIGLADSPTFSVSKAGVIKPEHFSPNASFDLSTTREIRRRINTGIAPNATEARKQLFEEGFIARSYNNKVNHLDGVEVCNGQNRFCMMLAQNIRFGLIQWTSCIAALLFGTDGLINGLQSCEHTINHNDQLVKLVGDVLRGDDNLRRQEAMSYNENYPTREKPHDDCARLLFLSGLPTINFGSVADKLIYPY